MSLNIKVLHVTGFALLIGQFVLRASHIELKWKFRTDAYVWVLFFFFVFNMNLSVLFLIYQIEWHCSTVTRENLILTRAKLLYIFFIAE